MNQGVVHFRQGGLSEQQQRLVSAGFEQHSGRAGAPAFTKERLHWTVYGAESQLVGVATADKLWDWLYIDELWVDESVRGRGVGRQLIKAVESYAREHCLVGVWLWTQSWQAEEFYRAAGYAEFARFPDFPRGYERIGFRKLFQSNGTMAAG